MINFRRMPDAKLPAVPETILKRRKRQAENRANRAKLAVKAKVDRRKKRVHFQRNALSQSRRDAATEL